MCVCCFVLVECTAQVTKPKSDIFLVQLGTMVIQTSDFHCMSGIVYMTYSTDTESHKTCSTAMDSQCDL